MVWWITINDVLLFLIRTMLHSIVKYDFHSLKSKVHTYVVIIPNIDQVQWQVSFTEEFEVVCNADPNFMT